MPMLWIVDNMELWAHLVRIIGQRAAATARMAAVAATVSAARSFLSP